MAGREARAIRTLISIVNGNKEPGMEGNTGQHAVVDRPALCAAVLPGLASGPRAD